MDQAPIVIAKTWNDTEAAVIKSLLASYQVPCHCTTRIPHNICPINMEGVSEIRIFVPATLASYARDILDEHRRPTTRLRLVDAE